MTFATLRSEFFARGFSYLDDGGVLAAKVDRWLNQGYLYICDQDLWPFRSDSSTGDAPLEISDLGQIESVRLTADQTVLAPISRQALSELAQDLTIAGTASNFYVEDGTEVHLFPYASDEIVVQYWSVPFEMTLATDVPIMPARFHDLIVDAAAVRAYKDRDDHDIANTLRQGLLVDVDNMRKALLTTQEPDMILSAYGYW